MQRFGRRRSPSPDEQQVPGALVRQPRRRAGAHARAGRSVVDPQLLRGGFRIGFTILAIALLTLPFQPRDSAELVVTVLAAVVSGAFVLGIALLARASDPRLPNDKQRSNGYNERRQRRGQ